MLFDVKNGCVRADGMEMDYARLGRGKRSLVVLPGLSDGLSTVRGKAALLAGPFQRWLGDWTVWMFSRRRELPEGCGIGEMAADQAAALRALGLERVSVLGVSEGGMIAQALALSCPELVEKLVVAVSTPGVNELIRANLARWCEAARAGDHGLLMRDTAEASYSEAALKRMRPMLPLLGLVGKPADYRRFLINCEAILRFDLRVELPKLRCKTLILGAEEDRIVGAEASRELSRLIPGSELYLYPGLGHAAYEEAPDFYERVFRFLETDEAGG